MRAIKAHLYGTALELGLELVFRVEAAPKGRHSYVEEPRTLGELIRNKRLEEGLQVKELAGILGVCQETLMNWEAGRREPRNTRKIEKWLECGG